MKITGSGLWLAWLYSLFHSQSSGEWQICCISAHTDIKQCHTMNTANHVYFLKAHINVIAALNPILFCEDRCVQRLWFQIKVDFFILSVKYYGESHQDAHLHQCKAKPNWYSYTFSENSNFCIFTTRANTQCNRSYVFTIIGNFICPLALLKNVKITAVYLRWRQK